MTPVPDTRTIEKQCDCCDASASGPRIVQVGELQRPDSVVFQYSYVEMACDRCDAPWRTPVPGPRTPPDPKEMT